MRRGGVGEAGAVRPLRPATDKISSKSRPQGKVRSEVTPFQCCSESSLVTCLSNLREHFENISILGMLSPVRPAAYTETGLWLLLLDNKKCLTSACMAV